MGGFVFLVPVLLVVVAGYSVGYVVAEALGVGEPEAVGWPAGFLLLAVVTVVLLRWRRRRRARSSPRASGPPSRRR